MLDETQLMKTPCQFNIKFVTCQQELNINSAHIVKLYVQENIQAFETTAVLRANAHTQISQMNYSTGTCIYTQEFICMLSL